MKVLAPNVKINDLVSRPIEANLLQRLSKTVQPPWSDVAKSPTSKSEAQE